MLLLLVPAAQVCARRCKFPRAVRPVRCSPKCSRPVPTPYPHRVASLLRSVIPMRITGNGTCTTPLKGRTTLVTRTLSNICVKPVRKRFWSWTTWGCRSLASTMAQFINVRLAASRRTSAASRRHVLRQRPTVPVMHYCTRCISRT